MSLLEHEQPRKSIHPRGTAILDLDTPVAKTGFDHSIADAAKTTVEDLSLDPKKMVGSYCLAGAALESILEKAKTSWKNLGVLKTDRTTHVQKLMKQNSEGKGKDIEARISALPEIKPISPIWAEAGGDD